jgi:phospholipase C
VYDPLAANGDLFRQTALVITYDEHGGFYDHVIPGKAPNPDGKNSPNPDDTATFKVPFFAFDRIGLRVPSIIVSPWIEKGTVEHRDLQHTSVIATVREIFGLNGPLNNRDASAQSFADLFRKLDTPRVDDDMPKTLDRAPVEETIESVVAGVNVHPADEPLDSLTEEWAEGMLAMVRGPHGVALPQLESVDVVPRTQGEAAAAVEQRLRAAGL